MECRHVLRLLRTKTGWPKALALLAMVSFALGLLHSHSAPYAADFQLAFSHADAEHAGHDHAGGGSEDGPSVHENCAFCAVVAGKYFLPPLSPPQERFVAQRVRRLAVEAVPRSVDPGDLFRPPIAAAS